MAYADPANIREREVRLRLNEREWGLVRSLVDYTGQQMGPLLREMLLSHASLVLSGQADVALSRASSEAPQQERVEAA
jgi:hypothetical protein